MRATHPNSNDSGPEGKRRAIRGEPAIALLAAAVLLALGVAPAYATDFVVTDAGDSGPGTLRQAVLDANANAGPHTISFALPTGATIGLTSGEIEFSGPDVTVQGPGRDQLTISGNQSSRIFEIQGNGTVAINDLTLRDGLAAGDGSNQVDQRGGAILAGVPQFPFEPPPPDVPGLVLTDVAIFDSRAFAPTDGGGGAVFIQDGTLTIDHCLMAGNFSRRNGGAVTARRGTVQITDSQFIDNTTDFSSDEGSAQGGGVFINLSNGSIARSVIRGNHLTDINGGGTATEGAGFAMFMLDEPFRIEDSEISDNESVEIALSLGGGLLCRQNPDGSAPVFTLINSTVSGNTSNYGAGVEVGCSMSLLNTTIANNTSTNAYGDGGAPGILAYSPNTTEQTQLTITSSLVSGNLGGGPDVGIYHLDGYADPAFLGSNALVQSVLPDPSLPPSPIVSTDFTLPSDTIIGVDPLLGAVANNGGPTRTHALQTGSVAIDAGGNPQALTSDQRGPGFARMTGVAADIGAFESDVDRILTNGFE
jgi:hypothetical protein